MATTYPTTYGAKYPLRSGDYDEYTDDRISVTADRHESMDPLDVEGACFAPDRAVEAVAWLIDRGCDTDNANDLVAWALDPANRFVRAYVDNTRRGVLPSGKKWAD
jgi:hypothetical protein